MKTQPPPNPNPSDLPPNDADQRMLDALLCTAGESDARRAERVDRVLQAVGGEQAAQRRPAVIGRIRQVRWLGPAGLAAAILIALWVGWPSERMESAYAVMARVVAAAESATYRRYNVTVTTDDGQRVPATLDVAAGGRFVGQVQATGPMGRTVSIIAGSDGEKYWRVPPIGRVRVSDEPIGPLVGMWSGGQGDGAEILTIHRLVGQLQRGYEIRDAEIEDPQLVRLNAMRKEGEGSRGITPLIRPAWAEVIAQRDSGDIVEVTFSFDESFRPGERTIRSITFTLQPDAEEPQPEWYEHESHHSGRPVRED